MNATRKFTNIALILLLAGSLTAAGCAGGPLTTREKGAGIGALGGAAAGGLIGSGRWSGYRWCSRVGDWGAGRRPAAGPGESELQAGRADSQEQC
jgi:hypothetical protein